MGNELEKLMELMLLLQGMGLLTIILVSFFFTIGVWMLHAITLMLGAKIVKVEQATFGKALLSVTLIIIVGGLITSLLSLINPFLGFIGLFLPFIIIQLVFSCSFAKAIVSYILSFVLAIVLYILALFAIMFGISAFAKNFSPPEKSENNKLHEIQKKDKISNNKDALNSDTAVTESE